MADQEIKCKDCPNTFTFTERDQAFFAEKGFTPPKRCRPCRDEAKLKRAQQPAPAAVRVPEPSYQEERRGKKGNHRRGDKGHW